jgi:aspartyl-tRNA(Asn)/glutamyl-tRNA(Gln) amidotransferase subunit C
MKITPAEVAKVASLARLELSDEKVELFVRQLNDVLDYMDLLGKIDTSEVEPLYSPVDHPQRLREDVMRKETEREEILANAPEDDGQYFIVPKIVSS